MSSIPGAWTTQDQTVILRGFRDIARVEFAGRVFVIENFDPFRGYIDPEVVMLPEALFQLES